MNLTNKQLQRNHSHINSSENLQYYDLKVNIVRYASNPSQESKWTLDKQVCNSTAFDYYKNN